MNNPSPTLQPNEEPKPRPYVHFNDDRIALFLDCLANGYNASSAARKVGVDPRTVRFHLSKDKEFKAIADEYRSYGIDTMEDLVREKAHALPGMPGVISALAWLKAHRRDKWGDKLETTSHATLHIIVGPAPSIEELRQQDARMALPMPDTVQDDPYGLREPAEDGQYREMHDADSST